MEITGWMEKIFNSLSEGIMIVDGKGQIVFFNKAYSKFIGKSLEEVKGLEIRIVRPGSVIQDVISTGVPKLGFLRNEGQEKYFCNIHPIFSKDKIVGGISTVTFLKDAVFLSNKIRELEQKNSDLMLRVHENNGTRYRFKDIVAISPKSATTKKMAEKIASSNVSVLIQGESGTGKELYAQSIHNGSDRSSNPFVAINCSTLNSTMLESELFGYEEGAFTGAKKGGKRGLFEAADKGTIFLDEISEMDYGLQAKLLRVLQEGKVRRIGSTKEVGINVRIICACNVDLIDYINQRKFRRDLYYRIAVFPIYIQPLRERREDISHLLDIYLSKMSNKLRMTIELTTESREILKAYSWPGNVREVKNVIEFSSIMASKGLIKKSDLPYQITEQIQVDCNNVRSLSETIKEVEKQEIQKAIDFYGDSVDGKKKAAKSLGISLATLYHKLSLK